jgi:hypothetical protein
MGGNFGRLCLRVDEVYFIVSMYGMGHSQRCCAKLGYLALFTEHSPHLISSLLSPTPVPT